MPPPTMTRTRCWPTATPSPARTAPSEAATRCALSPSARRGPSPPCALPPDICTPERPPQPAPLASVSLPTRPPTAQNERSRQPPLPPAKQQQQQQQHQQRVLAIVVDGYSFALETDYDPAAVDALVAHVRREVAHRCGIVDAEAGTLVPPGARVVFFPDPSDAFAKKIIDAKRHLKTSLYLHELETRHSCRVVRTGFKRENNAWKASMEDMAAADCCAMLATPGCFAPVGATRERLSATDVAVVTSDRDHEVTLNSTLGSPLCLRWCVAIGAPTFHQRQWGASTQRLLTFPTAGRRGSGSKATARARTPSGTSTRRRDGTEAPRAPSSRRCSVVTLTLDDGRCVPCSAVEPNEGLRRALERGGTGVRTCTRRDCTFGARCRYLHLIVPAADDAMAPSNAHKGTGDATSGSDVGYTRRSRTGCVVA